jgi:tetratricopeptide (TPR) repeat protein
VRVPAAGDTHRRRLAELSAEDRGVAAAFTLSYQYLDPAHQRMFRLLGLHPGGDIDARAAAALAGVTTEHAEVLMEDLLDAHMLLQHEPGRYTFHDLLREHAGGTAAAEETATARHDALTRLLDYYLHAAGAAMNVVFPVGREHRPHAPAHGRPDVPMAGAGDAIAWLDAERANLVAAGARAAHDDWPAHAGRLAATLSAYLYDYGHHTDAVTLHTQALQASRRAGDQAGEARTLTNLAWVNFRQGRYRQAGEHARRALDICRSAGDRYGQARALNVLGNLCSRQHDFAHAHEHFRRALGLYRELGERAGETHALGNLGIVYERQGRYEPARDHLRQALDLYHELGDQGLEEAIARTHLGVVCRRLGRYQEARDHHQRALEVFRELGNRSEEADARNGLGEAARAMGDPARAVTDHEAALALARQAGNRLEQARAHHGLAYAHRDLGRTGPAREHVGQAVDIYTGLGVADAAEARDLLASLGPRRPA